ncbi:hypothetical protein NF556_03845 [Ornithinimicrobium faecis]|uniref:ATP-dependent endonuclease n=1 Tax=Ornithinimicrobium faecis TaxID=2934158 RepID=A0ABY4YVK0_9MICO|nr:hypothetical protein [Ornithinimicrobium sp. HY1793]USQ80801.1 hypothetical protein NF556_03845 [Ornithinimicrobium sp. HY1793]
MRNMPVAGQPPATLVLLEGPSDVAAVTTLLAAQEGAGERSAYELVDLGGVTNVGAHLRRAAHADPSPRVVGLCDAGEARVVLRALQRVGRAIAAPQELSEEAFFVCDRDLEDELIRALGPQRCLEVLEEQRLSGRFAAFSRQPAWAGRPLTARLHRFCGVASGRKILLAGAMAAALTPDQVPPPLAGLLESLQEADARAWQGDARA